MLRPLGAGRVVRLPAGHAGAVGSGHDDRRRRAARNVLFDYYRAVGARELAGCLAPMLRGLSPEYREAVKLAGLDGVSQAEAARRAGVSLSGMKSRVPRGRRQLRAALEACCRVERDRRGGIAGYDRSKTAGCGSCGEPGGMRGRLRTTDRRP